MHYEDLELCRYHSGPLDSDSWHVPLRSIGWLESGHPYNRGPTPIALVEQINALVDNAERVFQQYHFRGFHEVVWRQLFAPPTKLFPRCSQTRALQNQYRGSAVAHRALQAGRRL